MAGYTSTLANERPTPFDSPATYDLRADRLRLRGLTGTREEFLLTATAQNLRRMVKCLGTGPPVNREMVEA